MINPAVFQDLTNLRRKLVRTIYIALIELDMHLERSVRDSFQPMYIERFDVVVASHFHMSPPVFIRLSKWSPLSLSTFPSVAGMYSRSRSLIIVRPGVKGHQPCFPSLVH